MGAGTSRLEALAELLEQLDGQTSFRVAGGPLGARLREAVLAELDADAVESLADCAYDIYVSIAARAGAAGVIDCRLECEGAEHAAEVEVSNLSGRELHELSLRLQGLAEARSSAVKGTAGRVTIRRKAESDRYDILQATQKLKVTAEWLKNTIPCTGYRYEDTGGRKTMRDLFWSRELIERLCALKVSRPRREDEQYVAEACCDGDLGWAKDIIRSLRKPEPQKPQINEKFKTRIRAKVISRQLVNEPAPRRKKSGVTEDKSK